MRTEPETRPVSLTLALATHTSATGAKTSSTSTFPKVTTSMPYGDASTSMPYALASHGASYGNPPDGYAPITTVAPPAYGGLLLQQGQLTTMTTAFLTTGAITVTRTAHNYTETTTYTGQYSVILESIGSAGYGGDYPDTATITQGTLVTATDSSSAPSPSTESGLPMPTPIIPTPSTTLYFTHTEPSVPQEPTTVKSATSMLPESTISSDQTATEPAAATVTQQSQASPLSFVAIMLAVVAALMVMVF